MAANTSTAADSTNNIRYDVFISHRGPDVKKTFASHLYRRLISYGLRVFLDYQELQEGEDLTCQIKGAIRTASIHVAIFSPTYADSNWCLDELLLMLESGAPIIPVFHHVKPADLRWTQGEGVYAGSLRNLEKKRAYGSQPRYNSTTIENWRNALSRVSVTSGLHLEAFNDDEGALLDKVVDVVFRKGVKTQLNVARYPTGLDEKVEDFEKEVLLQQHSGRVKLVGITGSGGVGKTTLAKELFNRKSSDYCKSYFLFDIRENAKNSLHSLQSKLLKGLLQRDMPVDNKDEGIEMLKKLLSSSPVLLVLDDVDKVDQVEALLPVDVLHHDSLILITSRDKNILLRSRVQESSIYKLTGLNTELSRELFCSHAFCQPHPLSGFEYLVNQFLKACDGLPLSLKVFGGLLYGNTNKSYWESELERLEQILPDEIQERLQISYDALPRDEKQMFLDIACFFIGENRDTVIRVWDGSGWNGARGFQSLMNKCLVQVEMNVINYPYRRIENCIRMHDHLRDLGRDLANGSGLPCRLWRGKKDMDDFLQQSNETTKVRGIRYYKGRYASTADDYDELTLTNYVERALLHVDDDERASFSRYKMKSLQLLDTDIEKDLLKCLFEGVDSPELLWFRWRNWSCSSSLPLCIPMKKLRVLRLEGDDMETLWPEELQAPLQLRELRIRASLFKIPKSIGQLKRLERMEVTSLLDGGDCEIPEEFCYLGSLKHLTLHIQSMRSLPDSFGNLSKLEHIDLSDSVELERLPDSFGNLTKLRYLDLKHCSNLTLSSGTFEKISTLEYIDLTGCHKIEVLPFQILHQGFREELYFELRNLKEWSSAIGESCPLKKLVLETPSLERLPSSLGRYLRNLKYLELRGCRSLKRLPDSFLLLNQLTEWIVEDCSLQELSFNTLSTESKGERRSSNLDSSFDKCLPRLQHLRLCNTEISKISFPTGTCPNLQHLQIQNCNDLVEVGTLPTALVKLEVICCPRLRKIEGFCGLSELQKLRIGQHGEGLQSIEPLVSEGMTLNLKYLELRGCRSLKRLPDSFLLLNQLTEWIVEDCSLQELRFNTLSTESKGEKRLSNLDSSFDKCLLRLQVLRLHNTEISKISFPTGTCPNLQHLQIQNCNDLVEVGTLPTALVNLEVTCPRLRKIKGFCDKRLPSIETLVSLEESPLFECVKLKNIEGLRQLTQLRELNVSGWSKLEELPGLEHLRSLEKLSAGYCVKLKSIRFSAQLTELRELNVSLCSELEELPGFEHLRSLEKLLAYECVKLKSLRCSSQLLQLRELYVYGCSELEEIPGLEQVMSLEKLWAFKCVKLRSIQGLAQLSQLRELYVYGCSELEELPGFEHLRSLEKLWAYECVKLKSLRCSAQLLQLRELNVSLCSELEELPGFEHLRSLEKLSAYESVKLKSLQGLAQLTQLRELYVYGCSELEELPGFEHLRSLEKLSAYECVKLKRLRCSAQLLQL